MDLGLLEQRSEHEWHLRAQRGMRVPAVIYADRALLEDMDDKVCEQLRNVAMLPGIVGAAYAMPDAHWGYGFPIGGVAAFDPDDGGVVSAGGVGFDISCGVRALTTGLTRERLEADKIELADRLFEVIPAGLGSRGSITLDESEMSAMLAGGARWAVESGWGDARDLERIEEHGCMAGARPECVSARARDRQRREMGTLGSGNHYLEVQQVVEVFEPDIARVFGLAENKIIVSIHCGSRGLGHQIGTEFLKAMAVEAGRAGIRLPDRELACAPIRSAMGERYLGAMRGAINCALANRQIITHLARRVFGEVFPGTGLELVFDVSHNTCKVERHRVDGRERELYVHRKGATRAFGPGWPDLPPALREAGQPVLIGGSMGTASYVLAGVEESEARAWSSACHGAGRAMSRRQATRRWQGRQVVDELAARGILIRSPSWRGVAEEAPGAYKDVGEVVDAAARAGLARKIARLVPVVCVKG
ncbi:MAG: RtcB family protein [Wenzhouxiangellaceae bacterium]|nr:RtcB family protein [Wenzhouxiangellaceae bacterium]